MSIIATKPERSGTAVRLTSMSGFTLMMAETMITTAATGEAARMMF